MSAEVVTAAMVFWNPETIRTQWEASAAVTPRAEASEAEALTNRATDRDYAVFPEDEAAEFVALAAAAVAE